MKELRKQVGIVFNIRSISYLRKMYIKIYLLGLKNWNGKHRDFDKVNKTLEIVGLNEDILDKSPFELSGGQKRRVAIAGVLVMEPEIIVLDEPAAGLDPKGRNEIFNFIQRLYENFGITVILVSHNMEEITRLVERVIVMNKGTIEMDGHVKDIFKDTERLEQLGLSAPQITYLMKRLKKAFRDIDDNVYTVKDAKKEIMRYLRKPAGDRSD